MACRPSGILGRMVGWGLSAPIVQLPILSDRLDHHHRHRQCSRSSPSSSSTDVHQYLTRSWNSLCFAYHSCVLYKISSYLITFHVMEHNNKSQVSSHQTIYSGSLLYSKFRWNFKHTSGALIFRRWFATSVGAIFHRRLTSIIFRR